MVPPLSLQLSAFPVGVCSWSCAVTENNPGRVYINHLLVQAEIRLMENFGNSFVSAYPLSICRHMGLKIILLHGFIMRHLFSIKLGMFPLLCSVFPMKDCPGVFEHIGAGLKNKEAADTFTDF